MRNPAELLKRLIEIPSVSREETQAADVMEAEMKERGLSVKRYRNNLWAMAPDYDAEKPTLLLNAHIDTVKPVNGWQRNPFQPVLEDGKLYGLGSNDCGGGLVALLETFCLLSGKPQDYNLIYLASAEEEVSGVNGICSVLPLLPKVDVALVGEPTSLQPAISERGLMVLDCTAHGRSGHAARNEGVNAIYVAMEDIRRLQAYEFEKVSDLLGPVKTTVTIIQAGTQHNVIPDTCTFTIDARINECYSNVEILQILEGIMLSEVHARSTRLASSHISEHHPLIQRLIAMGKVPFGSPTLSDQALMSWPSFKLGPGDSARSHTADEYIPLEDIDNAISLYMKLLDGMELK